MEEIKPKEAFVIAPLKETFKVKGLVYTSLEDFINNKLSKYMEVPLPNNIVKTS